MFLDICYVAEEAPGNENYNLVLGLGMGVVMHEGTGVVALGISQKPVTVIGQGGT